MFLLPLIIFYEVVSGARQGRVIAFDLLRQFLLMFGHVGLWAPGLAVILILLATHVASGERWVVHWREVGFMYLEAVVLAAPLLVLYLVIPLAASPSQPPILLSEIAMSIGAGIYEELVFRLALITLIVLVGTDILRLRPGPVAAAAILLSSLAFAAHHHPPMGAEPFLFSRFLFRTFAGAYLAVVFWYRGYGPAAGCHAAYNVALITWHSLE